MVGAALPVRPARRSSPGVLTRRAAMTALAGTVVLPVVGRAGTVPTLHERHTLFGSPCDVIVRAEAGARAEAGIAAAFAALRHMNERWNAWKEGDVAALNRSLAAGRVATTTPEVLGLVRGAAALERASSGLFNAGIGALVGAWGFHDDEMRAGARPSPAVLAAARRGAPGLAQLEVRGLQVRSANPRLQLDFGAVAKGVAIDRVLGLLRRRGLDAALVNLGGNLAAMAPPGRPPWAIGIRDPFGPGLAARLDTRGREAVVTSGSYERWRLLDGERCTHILDPGTGAPAHDLVSVTVVHPDAAWADGAATALLVAGAARWRQLAERMGVTQVLVIDREGRGQATAPLAARLQVDDPGWRRRIVAV